MPLRKVKFITFTRHGSEVMVTTPDEREKFLTDHFGADRMGTLNGTSLSDWVENHHTHGLTIAAEVSFGPAGILPKLNVWG